MIAIDTNVLVRYIMQDDPIQSPIATRLIEQKCDEKNPALINHLVLCETLWVLQRTYGYKRDKLVPLLKQILATDCFEIPQRAVVWNAVYDFESHNADFSDYLICHSNKFLGAGLTYTFDKKAAKHKHCQLLDSSI